MSTETNETTASRGILCEAAKQDLMFNGRFITADEARASLEAYFRESGLDPNAPDHIYGYTFGLHNVRLLLQKIDIWNAQASDSDNSNDQIAGIRVYYGKSTRRNYQEYDPNTEMRDVFFMPVLKNGEDLHRVHFLPGDSILGEGRPCPNECGNKFIDIKR